MKKKMVLIIALIFMLSVNVLAGSNLVGDVDGNGTVGVKDYLLIRKHLLKISSLTGDNLKKADVNQDGKLTVSDYLLVRKIILFGQQVVAKKEYIVTYKSNGGTGSDTTQTVTFNDNWTTKGSIFTRLGYNLVGWSTTASGGLTHNLNKEQGKWTDTSNLTLYAVWNKNSQYIITEDSKYSGYSNIAEYTSSTLKYRIVMYKGQYIILLWAENPYLQFNSALAKSNAQGTLPAENILNNEIEKYNYQRKGLIAVNGSFFANGTPTSGVVISHGIVAKNTGDTGETVGITKSNVLQVYWHESLSTIQADGVRSLFTISSVAKRDNSTDVAERTQICQYDKNNYVLLSGNGTVKGVAAQLEEFTGCSGIVNMDGGGSRKIYFKSSSTKEVTKLYGGGRELPDMLYFVEQ